MDFTDEQIKNMLDYLKIEDQNVDDQQWQEKLQKSRKGRNYSNAHNLLLILQNDENLKGKFAYNLLTHKIEIIGEVPWERNVASHEMTDYDDSCLRNFLSTNYEVKGKDLVHDVINQIVMEQSYHPIREYLENLGPWDGIPRLDNLLIDFFDAEYTELTRYQTRLTFVGAVKRALQPGCKMDYVLVLKGAQGIGKSTFLQAVAVKSHWFSDSLGDLRGKEAKEQIQGKWIIELGEMAAVSKGDQKRTKQFITSTYDEFRQSYGRRTVSYPRQCIFTATTNDDLPLKDDTGGRRWWIVEVKSKWFDKVLDLDVDQIWAEAVHVYEKMEVNQIPLKLPDYLENEAQKIQSQNSDRGPYADEIEYVLQRGYIEKRTHDGTSKIPIDKTCARHVWEEVLRRYKHEFNSYHARKINAVLRSLEGWEKLPKRVKFGEYGKQFVFRRKDS